MGWRHLGLVLACSYMEECVPSCNEEEGHPRARVHGVGVGDTCVSSGAVGFEALEDVREGYPQLTFRFFADFDGDDRLDVLQLEKQWWLLPGLGTGEFATPVAYTQVPRDVDAFDDDVVVANIDGDAAMDLLVLDRQGFVPWLNHGDGFIEGPRTELPDLREYGPGPVVDDLDGDGRLEVLISTNVLLRLELAPDGAVLESSELLPTGSYHFAGAQLDGDPEREVLAVLGDSVTSIDLSSGSPVATTIAILPESNDDSDEYSEELPSGLLVGDFDGDGIDEMLLGVEVFSRDVAGVWAMRERLPILTPEGGYGELVLADIDADGDDDIVSIRAPGYFFPDSCGVYVMGAVQIWEVGGASGFFELDEFWDARGQVVAHDADSDGRMDVFHPGGSVMPGPCPTD